MITEKYLSYRGDIQALVGVGDTLLFITLHEEHQATALYRLRLDNLQFSSVSLKSSGRALCSDGQQVWLAANNKRIYQTTVKQGDVNLLTAELTESATALALLSQQRLAVLMNSSIAIINRQDGELLQTLPLVQTGTALAAHANGEWLVVGQQDGTVSVYDCEDKSSFTLSASAPLHQGAVTALLFEAEELRFFSAGNDLKLYSTHARGQLEPLDRGRSFNHKKAINCLLLGTAGSSDRFYSGSQDKTVKVWSRSSNTQPATLKEHIKKIVDLALLQRGQEQYLAVACRDNTLRIFSLDAAGKFDEYRYKTHDIYAWAREEFKQNDPKRRETAQHQLAKLQDAKGLDLLAERVQDDDDPTVRLMAAQFIGKTLHNRAVAHLEKFLTHKDETVRLKAFADLRKQLDAKSMRPMELVLSNPKVKSVPGIAALEALEDFAKKDDRALQLLLDSLNLAAVDVTRAALKVLEFVYGKQLQGTLMGLRSQQADIRRFALLRCYQRKALQKAEVLTAIRHATEDSNPHVRHIAFLVLMLSQPRLVTALRARDKDLHRQFYELEQGQVAGQEIPAAPAATASQVKLSEAELAPLLQTMASRNLDTCLAGACSLAQLGHPRAFGLLLQLSQAEHSAARVEVCRALAALDDPRSLTRLTALLQDNAIEVRDAAFSALAQLHHKHPLQSAALGLDAHYEDVRQRGLQGLVRELRHPSGGTVSDIHLSLLKRALNDEYAAVRSEAFKTALNLNISGDTVATLRFIMNSIHADIRREVLTECMAQYQQEWAQTLLNEFLNDPAAELRREALDFTYKRYKHQNFAALAVAIESHYRDMRLAAIQALTHSQVRQAEQAQSLLLKVLNDSETEIRTTAIGGLLDNELALTQALHSQYADVRLIAAHNRASHGDTAALQPLLALATLEEPQEKQAQQEWFKQILAALSGLAELGDVHAIEPLKPLLDSRHAPLRAGYAHVLQACADGSQIEFLHSLLPHQDKVVRYRAALSLAYQGVSSIAPLVFSQDAEQVLSVWEQLAASLTLGEAGEAQLLRLLAHPDAPIQHVALLLVIFKEWQQHNGTPERLLTALAAQTPKMRLASAEILEHFTQPEAWQAAVTQLLNQRLNRQDSPWQLSAKAVHQLARLLVHASKRLKVRCLSVLQQLFEQQQQSHWQQYWRRLQQRYATEIAALQPVATAEIRATDDAIHELLFGAYVGLAREQPSTQGEIRQFALSIADIRLAALRGLIRLVAKDEGYLEPVYQILIQALNDNHQNVRLFAFVQLQALQLDTAVLGAEALATGYRDIGVEALQLLSGEADKAGQQVLEHIMLTRNLDDGLEFEAAQLLAQYTDIVKVAKKCLNATAAELRTQAVQWLAENYIHQSLARTTLRAALDNRYLQVRRATAFALAHLKDPAVIATLRDMLFSSHSRAEQRACVQAYERMGDPSCVGALLHRVVEDPQQDAEIDLILAAVGRFRDPESAEKVLPLLEQRKTMQAAYRALLTISGYDQAIANYEEDEPIDPEAEQQLRPRHDTVLAHLFDRCFTLHLSTQVTELIRLMRWARDNCVNIGLTQATLSADETIRRMATEAIGWRLRKRQVDAQVLIDLLKHRDVDTQFLAAEGLARAAQAEGLNVLLSAVELLPDWDLRIRAVQALGELADERALDVLLKLASDEEHALQETAVAALGHLGQSAQAEQILKLLKRYVRSDNDDLAVEALQGLRWFNSGESWAILREFAAQKVEWHEADKRDTAIAALGYDDSPATRELLLTLILETDDDDEDNVDVVEAAYHSAVRLFGVDSFDLNYKLLQTWCLCDLSIVSAETVVKRVCKQANAEQLLAVLPQINTEYVRSYAPQAAVIQYLLQQQPLPIAAAAAQLSSPAHITVATAAYLLGRAGEKAVAHSDVLVATLQHWLQLWQQHWTDLHLHNQLSDERLDHITACASRLIWAVGQLQVGVEVLCDTVQGQINTYDCAGVAAFQPLRLAALQALAVLPNLDAEVLDALQPLAQDGAAELRRVATQVLSQHPTALATLTVAPLLADRLSFQTLRRASTTEATLPLTAVQQSHYQGILLPELVNRQQTTELLQLLHDKSLAETVRLGVIEGLARLAEPSLETELKTLGTDESETESLRRAAWRGVKRSQRLRVKNAVA